MNVFLLKAVSAIKDQNLQAMGLAIHEDGLALGWEMCDLVIGGLYFKMRLSRMNLDASHKDKEKFNGIPKWLSSVKPDIRRAISLHLYICIVLE